MCVKYEAKLTFGQSQGSSSKKAEYFPEMSNHSIKAKVFFFKMGD